jgi:hypothetical protein
VVECGDVRFYINSPEVVIPKEEPAVTELTNARPTSLGHVKPIILGLLTDRA